MTVLTSDLPANMTLEMPCNNLLTTIMKTADASTLFGNGGTVYQTLFVDAVNAPATGADGSIIKPFATLQAAINYAAVTKLWTEVNLMIAPGTYAGAVTVPWGIKVAFTGWDATGINPPILSGDISVVGGVGAFGYAGFRNVVITATNIVCTLPTEDMWLTFDNCVNLANISGGNDVVVELRQTGQLGDQADPAGTCTYKYDGPSWSYYVTAMPVMPAAIIRRFFDAGHDTFELNLVKNGIAIGDTGFATLSISTGILFRLEDFAHVQVIDATVQDFTCGVHGTGPIDGIVTFWIRNLSRASTNFLDPIRLVIHHDVMVPEPVP